jgi:membrane-associated phospholipid phosphatase
MSVRGKRVLLIVAALGLWFASQALLGRRSLPDGGMVDVVHNATAGWNRWLADHPRSADGLLIVSSLGIDALGLFLLASAVFGPSLRPAAALILVFAFRQICQFLVALPPPTGMIWRDPGFPSLLVTYGVAGDFFFSGHTAIAVLGAGELARRGPRWRAAGTLLAIFEMGVVLILRAHYTLDVVAGAVAALWVAPLAERVAAPLDRWIA